ncbi:MAG: hypothetical protein U5K31_05190 [Balneolaceae bacterium]|nr:hypothetical protein [Balneolaceae bacterium]
MNDKDRSEGRKTASNIHNKSEYHSRLAGLIEQVHASSVLHLIAGAAQVGLGLTVVLISVLGLVSPLWFSTVLTMFASVVTMLGVWLLYSSFAGGGGSDSLIREAIRRIMDARN